MWKPVFTAALSFVSALAQTPQDLRGLRTEWIELGAPAHALLRFETESGGIKITPSEDGKVRIRATGRRAAELTGVRVRFSEGKDASELRITEAPSNDFQAEIQVPRACDLYFRMPAGELMVQGIAGHKDLKVSAGEITLQVGDPAAYAHVEASVWAGEINPGPFGRTKGGLFRSFQYEGPGRYRLVAKVRSGEVDFVK